MADAAGAQTLDWTNSNEPACWEPKTGATPAATRVMVVLSEKRCTGSLSIDGVRFLDSWGVIEIRL